MLVELIYGAGLFLTCILAALSRKNAILWTVAVLAVDYSFTKIVLQFQPYPGALWAWPVMEAFGALSMARIRMDGDRPSLMAVAGLYVLRAAVLDVRHIIDGNDYAYVVGTNLVWLLQAIILASEGVDAGRQLIGKWGGDLRVRVVRLAMVARSRE